jgi:hypothetical protein
MVLIKNTFELTIGLIAAGTVVEIAGKGLKFFPQRKSLGNNARAVGRVFQNCAAAIFIAPILESTDETKTWSVYLIRVGLGCAAMTPVRALWNEGNEDNIFYAKMISGVAKLVNTFFWIKMMEDSSPNKNFLEFCLLATATIIAL